MKPNQRAVLRELAESMEEVRNAVSPTAQRNAIGAFLSLLGEAARLEDEDDDEDEDEDEDA